MKYAYIKDHHPSSSIAAMCRALPASRSGYYAWRHRKETPRARNRRSLLADIRRVHDQSKQRYGIIKYWKQLNQEGIRCGRDQVAGLREVHNIYAKRRRRFVVTTRSKHRHWIAPNRLQRDFTAIAPNHVWVGDVTFIATRTGWLYLAILIDLYSRKVVGWSMSNSNNGTLVKEALTMAIEHRKPTPGLIHHTDRGSTYAMLLPRPVTTTRHAVEHES